MKILFINYEYPPLGGGGGVAAKKLAEAYARKGYQVDYVTSWFKGLKHVEEINGVNVYRVKVWGRKNLANAGLLSLLTYPVCAYRLTNKLCKENKYDFINTHFAVPSGPLGAILGNKYQIKNILSVHGGDIYDPTKKFSPHKWWIFRTCIRWVIKKSDVIVAQSLNTADNVKMYYRCEKKVEIIPLAYDEVRFNKASREDLGLIGEDKYIISVGRLVKRKGYEYLIEAINQIKDNSIKAVIVGDGPEKEELKKLILDLNLEDRVKLLGSLSEEEKFQYLSNSDLYVLSSIHEGFGIVLQEAMQVGLPIVSTNFGGQVDLITEGYNGFLVDSKDGTKLAEAILRIFNDKDLYEKMRINNLELIKKYSSEAIISEYLRLTKK